MAANDAATNSNYYASELSVKYRLGEELIAACSNGDLVSVQRLVQVGADVNHIYAPTPYDVSTCPALSDTGLPCILQSSLPLTIAARMSSTDILDCLLAAPSIHVNASLMQYPRSVSF
jgi:hypothetical protein